jgi:hypothetical protein
MCSQVVQYVGCRNCERFAANDEQDAATDYFWIGAIFAHQDGAHGRMKGRRYCVGHFMTASA